MPKIDNSDISLRTIDLCSGSTHDYIDIDIRRIFTQNKNHYFENKIFEELIALCLTDDNTKITIKNCDFKKGVFIRQSDKFDFSYSIFIYKTNITNGVNLSHIDSNIDIDNCIIDNLYISGKRGTITLYASTIDKLDAEYINCDSFRVEQTEIKKYSLYKFNPVEVIFDNDDLAISDYKRFMPKTNQTVKQVSEIYHRAVLKSANSIKSASNINYQLTKATSDWRAMPFGYFYKPVEVVIWMTSIVFLFSLVYHLLLNIAYDEALYFSVYTFLTIGFGDQGSQHLLTKTILVYAEGLLGIVYGAALLTSIINSSRKQ
jgi:hypothetical protein